MAVEQTKPGLKYKTFQANNPKGLFSSYNACTIVNMNHS
jgi:hypothetical protein